MRDAHYTNARLVALYDTLNPQGPDTAFYLRMAGDTPLRVLDLGCGTGQLACALAEAGHTVTAVDPAIAMLAVARRRPNAEKVTWIQGNAVTVHLGSQFDYIVMTGHTLQIFVGDEDIRALLRTIRGHLAPGGRFAFETRNPLTRPWENWTPEGSARRVSTESGGAVDVHHSVVHVEDFHITFETLHRFEKQGDTLTSRSTLRFLNRDQVGDHLLRAGFQEAEWFGDWDGSPFTEFSREIIAVAR